MSEPNQEINQGPSVHLRSVLTMKYSVKFNTNNKNISINSFDVSRKNMTTQMWAK